MVGSAHPTKNGLLQLVQDVRYRVTHNFQFSVRYGSRNTPYTI
jgi:hypothetical protein